MKLIVETTGDFQLLDPTNGKVIRYDGLTVTDESPFLSSRAAIGQVRVVAQVNDEATDEELRKYAEECKGDQTLLLESFLASYGVEVEGQPEPEKAPKKRGKGKAKADEDKAEIEEEKAD
ncbi:hypothetical protein IZ6_25200 [Terrihabitans soli]|uniref:Uncharacterized protein n=1 Tax=Terrihabitans soli TaxID=708113 RepID=A0A6S6QW28_9HYPH|nr:hypothetical protein [Terrihabitans soli]BCJ91785.1 hypothetical protein IZ6_25200 [Terrihabitans soli]